MKVLLFVLACCASAAAQVRINAGGPSVAENSIQWEPDRSYNGGYVTSEPVPSGASQLYATKRYGITFSYAIPVADGKYTVALYLIDNTSTAPGERIFSVTLNGAAALTAYDLVADVGAKTPARKVFPVTAAGGTGLRLAFTTQAKSALVNAIEIIPVSTAPTRTYCEIIFALNIPQLPWMTGPALACDNMASTPARVKRIKCRDQTGTTSIDVQARDAAGTLRPLIVPRLRCGPAGLYGTLIQDATYPAGETLQFQVFNEGLPLSSQALVTVELE